MPPLTLPVSSLPSHLADGRHDEAPAPLLGRAIALMTAANARRAAADLRRQAAVIGDQQLARYRELMELAAAIEASKR